MLHGRIAHGDCDFIKKQDRLAFTQAWIPNFSNNHVQVSRGANSAVAGVPTPDIGCAWAGSSTQRSKPRSSV